MKKLVVLLSLSILTLSTTQVVGNENHTAKSSVMIYAAKTTKFRVTISFNSIGAGIDNESYDKIETMIKNHPKKLKYEVIQRGREGEKVIYLKLGELSADERKAFVDEVNNLIVKKDLVKVESFDKVQKMKKIKAKF